MSQTKTQLVEGLNINTSAPADALAVDDSGRVGVGTSSPNAPLDIKPSTNVAQLQLTQNNASDGWQFHCDGPNGGHLYLNRLASSVASTEFTILGSGNIGYVGIGVTDPAEELEVSGSGGCRIALNRSGNDGYGYIGTGTTNDLQFGRDGSGSLEYGRFDSSGRLLVGTTSEFGTSSRSSFYSKIQVKGNTDNINSDGRITLGTGATTGSDTSLGSVYFCDVDGGDRALIRGYSTSAGANGNYPGYLTFWTNSGTANPTERMRIDNGGRIATGNSGFSKDSLSGSTTQYLNLHLIGGAGTNNGAGIFIARNTPSTNANNQDLGNIYWGTNDGATFARIASWADGNSTASSNPGTLVFLTTKSGATAPSGRLQISNDGQMYHFADDYGHTLSTGTTYNGTPAFRVKNGATALNGGTNVMFVMGDGDLENANNRYTGFSDIKLKENVVDAGSQWDDIKALQVRKYNYKEETGFGTHTQIGLIAQEVELVSPGLVGETVDTENYEVERTDEAGNVVVELKDRKTGTTTKSVAYSVLYMKAVKALQEAMERIETLETANASQAATIAALDARLTALEGA